MKPYQHDLMVRDPVVTHGWFVCPTVSMVTTSHATGLEKTLLGPIIFSLSHGLMPILS